MNHLHMYLVNPNAKRCQEQKKDYFFIDEVNRQEEMNSQGNQTFQSNCVSQAGTYERRKKHIKYQLFEDMHFC